MQTIYQKEKKTLSLKNFKTSKFVSVLLGIVFLLLLSLLLSSCSEKQREKQHEKQHEKLIPQFKNSILFQKDQGGARIISDFALETISTSFTKANFKDKLTIIYFGYTSCPDVCPIELSQLAKAFNQLSKREIARVQGLFVSVDPKRDSLQKVTDYAQFFHKKIIGARIENPAKLLSFSKQLSSYYKIIAKKEDSLSKNNNYLVGHTSSFILIGPDGRYIGMMPAPHKPDRLSYDIKQLIQLYF